MLHAGTSKAIYTPPDVSGGNCLLREFLTMEGQDQNSSDKQNCYWLGNFLTCCYWASCVNLRSVKRFVVSTTLSDGGSFQQIA
jgi:hypothetical protein